MLDDWTVRFNTTLDSVKSADAWNRIQHLLRQVARSSETIFFAMQTSALIAILCCAARVLDTVMAKAGDDIQKWWTITLLELPPILLSAICALAWFVKATAITEQGARVPSLVNSLLVKPHTPIALDHQLLVGFIKNSDVGYYWKGSRLNTTVFINYCYLWGVVICGLFTTALKFNQQQ